MNVETQRHIRQRYTQERNLSIKQWTIIIKNMRLKATCTYMLRTVPSKHLQENQVYFKKYTHIHTCIVYTQI